MTRASATARAAPPVACRSNRDTSNKWGRGCLPRLVSPQAGANDAVVCVAFSGFSLPAMVEATTARAEDPGKQVKPNTETIGDEKRRPEAVYDVQQLVALRHDRKGRPEFLVRWKTYDSSHDTWVSSAPAATLARSLSVHRHRSHRLTRRWCHRPASDRSLWRIWKGRLTLPLRNTTPRTRRPAALIA